jgi:hypothetical protein
MPFLRHESSTAFTTIPRTKAGIFFMRAAAASSHAIVADDSRPYWIAGIRAVGKQPVRRVAGFAVPAACRTSSEVKTVKINGCVV